MNQSLDFPFWDVVETANEQIKKGNTVHQKYTCSRCRNRLTIETPNVFHKTGTCDKCNAVTNIEKHGCNYLIILKRTT